MQYTVPASINLHVGWVYNYLWALIIFGIVVVLLMLRRNI